MPSPRTEVRAEKRELNTDNKENQLNNPKTSQGSRRVQHVCFVCEVSLAACQVLFLSGRYSISNSGVSEKLMNVRPARHSRTDDNRVTISASNVKTQRIILIPKYQFLRGVSSINYNIYRAMLAVRARGDSTVNIQLAINFSEQSC